MEKNSRAPKEPPDEESEIETVELSALMSLETTRRLIAEKEVQRMATKEPPWSLL